MSTGDRGGTSPTGLAQEFNTADQTQASDQRPQEGQANADQNKAIATQVGDAAAGESVTTQKTTTAEEQRQQDDLRAQQDMAFYALLMLIATAATVILTGIGVWLLKRTLDATLQAVEDTGEATEAMVKQNEISLSSQRAWLCPDAFSMGGYQGLVDGIEVNQGFLFIPRWRNFGSSPAFGTQAVRLWKELMPNDEFPKFTAPVHDVETDGPVQSATIPPNSAVTALPVILNDAQRQRFFERQSKIIIYSRVTYFDTSSPNEHTSEVCMVVAHEGGTLEEDGRIKENVSFTPTGTQNLLT